MDVPLAIPTLCQVGLSRVTTLMWAGDHQGIIGSFREKFQQKPGVGEGEPSGPSIKSLHVARFTFCGCKLLAAWDRARF